MKKLLLSLLFLMCENVNADWPAATIEQRSGNVADGVDSARSGSQAVSDTGDAKAGSIPAGPASFVIAHPLCQTGFTIAQRFDQRNSSGAIIKSVWVRKCVRAPRIVYR